MTGVPLSLSSHRGVGSRLCRVPKVVEVGVPGPGGEGAGAQDGGGGVETVAERVQDLRDRGQYAL